MSKHTSFASSVVADDEEFEPRVATLKQGQIDEFYDIKEQLGK